VKGFSLLIGGAFGFLISASRLSDYQVIHDMLRLKELDVFLLMACAIGTAAPLLWLMQRRRWTPPFGGELVITRSPITRSNVYGAAVFGTGWAIAGTCPVPALAMTAGGAGLGLAVTAGLFGGIALRDRISAAKASEPSC
jgi:uncharacterized membrane protein YedE/YeeE